MLLFINSLKSLKEKKVILIILILIISLTVALSNAINLSLDSLENNYQNYLEQQNVEHVYLSVINYYDRLKYSDIDFSLIDTFDKNLLLNYFYHQNKLSYSSLEEVKNTLDKMDITKSKQEEILKQLQVKYNFNYEREQSKTIKQNKNNLVLFNLEENKTINKPWLIKGRWPKQNGEIVGDKNNFKINSTYTINNKKYKIVGLVYHPVYIYPMINVLNTLEDKILYLTNDDFNKITGIVNSGYAIKFNDYKRKYDFDKDTLTNKLLKENNIDYNIDTLTRINRINYLKEDVDNNKIIAKYFVNLLILITLFLNFILLKKTIDNDKSDIGILKSLGFSKIVISLSYLTTPVISIIIGSILGLIISVLLIIPFTNLYGLSFNIPLSNYLFNLIYFKQIIKLLIVLPLTTFIITYYLVNKKSLSLIKSGSHIKINVITRITNKIFYLFPFEYRFKLSLAFRSLGKLLIVVLVSLGASLLIVFVLIISNLFNQIVEDSFKDMKFNYLIVFNIPKKEIDNNNDYLLNIAGNFKEESINIIGIDNETKYFEVTDKQIKENEIVINENFQNKYNLKINDCIKITIGKMEYQYKIIDIKKGNTELYGYVNRMDLSKKIGYKDSVYNEMYSNMKKYISMDNLNSEDKSEINTILNIDDLKNNLKKQMKSLTKSIYLIITFSLIITFLVIIVISFVVIDENKNNIALLKILGYSNKKISKLVLNIYPPFIIITYFMAIPIIKKVIKLITYDLQKELDMILPITISNTQIIIGLIILLSIYYLAINLTKKSLNKIPLEIILKESR